jgi:hypothetical protein
VIDGGIVHGSISADCCAPSNIDLLSLSNREIRKCEACCTFKVPDLAKEPRCSKSESRLWKGISSGYGL